MDILIIVLSIQAYLAYGVIICFRTKMYRVGYSGEFNLFKWAKCREGHNTEMNFYVYRDEIFKARLLIIGIVLGAGVALVLRILYSIFKVHKITLNR